MNRPLFNNINDNLDIGKIYETYEHKLEMIYFYSKMIFKIITGDLSRTMAVVQKFDGPAICFPIDTITYIGWCL
jgi:hypothetical protein